MRFLKRRIATLTAVFVILLGVNMATGHERFHYSGYSGTQCAHSPFVAADSLVVLWFAGAVAYIDNLDPSGTCLQVPPPPSPSPP